MHEQRPVFSVIMPAYNHQAYIRQAVESVRAQTFTQWELIIVDDGSTDQTPVILEDLAAEDARILVVHQANAGPAVARNVAARRARAEWLAYIDSDDVWFPETLSRYERYLRAHPDATFLYGFRHRLDADGSITESRGEHQDRPTGTGELFLRMYLSHLCVCYRRALFEHVGGYDEQLRTCEDYELYLRMSLHCSFEPIGCATGLRRRHETNISRPTGHNRMLEAEVLRRFVERQGGAAVLDADQVNRRLARLYYSAGREYARARQYRNALSAAEMSLRRKMTLKVLWVFAWAKSFLLWTKRDEPDLPTV